jgi:chemotaxis protein CheX
MADVRVEHINPFIKSTRETFITMLGCEAHRGDVAVSQRKPEDPRQILAMVGLSGRMRGMVSITFPERTALRVVERLLGMEADAVDETVYDAISEMANIIAGGAKAELSGAHEKPLELSLPTVVHGAGYEVEFPSGAVWVEIPFESELGAFTVRVTFAGN